MGEVWEGGAEHVPVMAIGAGLPVLPAFSGMAPEFTERPAVVGGSSPHRERKRSALVIGAVVVLVIFGILAFAIRGA